MITLAEQHELDALKREVARLKRVEKQHDTLKQENAELKQRIKTEVKLKSKYKRAWHKAAGITPVNETKRNQAFDLLVEIANGFAMTLKDVAVITGLNYSTVKSMNRKLTT